MSTFPGNKCLLMRHMSKTGDKMNNNSIKNMPIDSKIRSNWLKMRRAFTTVRCRRHLSSRRSARLNRPQRPSARRRGQSDFYPLWKLLTQVTNQMKTLKLWNSTTAMLLIISSLMPMSFYVGTQRTRRRRWRNLKRGSSRRDYARRGQHNKTLGVRESKK